MEMLDIEDVKAELEAHGVKYHHRAGEDTLRKLLDTAINGGPEEDEEPMPSEAAPVVDMPAQEPAILSTMTPVEQEALALIRVIVSPNDPVQAGLHGHIFTVCSSIVNNGAAVKKFVPYNNEEGWHIPNIIYQQIKSAEMQRFKQIKLPNGDSAMEPYTTKMYNVTVLPPLTKDELNKLAIAQKARGGM